MKNKNLKRIIALVLVLAMVLGLSVTTAFAEENPNEGSDPIPDISGLKLGPNVFEDPDSPTGYTVRFLYKNDTAQSVTFAGDIGLRNWADPSDTKQYTPFEYVPDTDLDGDGIIDISLVRSGAFTAPMQNLGDGLWYYEVPLAAGANQYWFYIDGNTRYMAPDPANHPVWSPNSPENKNAYNAVYIPYSEKQGNEKFRARTVELPRETEKGTWYYEPIVIDGYTHYMGIYLPYGYDENREEPYKTIYMLHGGGQDESDWMGIGSVQNILDNLIAEGKTEPAVLVSVTTNRNCIGNAGNGYSNLFNIVIPYIESKYNVSTKAEDRSFAGLSMGCTYTQQIININATAFGYYGPWSNSIILDPNARDLDKVYMMFGVGRYDTGAARNMEQQLKNTLEGTNAKYKFVEVGGAHDFNAWCQLFAIYARDYLWKPEAFEQGEKLVEGPTVMKDPDSPTGYTVRFVYKNEEAQSVTFVGDILLRNWLNPSDTKVYTPYEYKPGLMRGGGAFEAEMERLEGGYWVIEVPLLAGANQYWFYVDGDRNHWVTDPANPPRYAPDGLTGTARRAFNAVYVPYDPEKQDAIAGARVIENPRTDEKKGTWSYVALPAEIDSTRTRYLGVYLPYDYDENREEPYKLIIMQHGGGQDASDWMNIGSVPNIMDNLLAEGLTEPAVVVTTDSTYLGNANQGYPNLFNIILPFLEENYNISTDPDDRAFAGLSMGGGITANLINTHAELWILWRIQLRNPDKSHCSGRKHR